MPRKTPVPDAEKEVCARIRSFRRDVLLMSQAAVARKLGIDSTKLASYEHGRVPVRYGFVKRFASTFNVSQIWLAEGQLPQRPYIPTYSILADSAWENELFSEVWLKHRGAGVYEWEEMAIMDLFRSLGKTANLLPPKEQSRQMFSWFVDSIKEIFFQLPIPTQWLFLNNLQAAASEFSPVEVGGEFPLEREIIEKTQLTETSQKRNRPPVNIRNIDDLLDSVRVKASGKGGMAALAKHLKVPQSRVSEWLNGHKKPNGETTLKLLTWVEQHERPTPK